MNSNTLEYILLVILATFIAVKVFRPMGQQLNDKFGAIAEQTERLTR